jgi:hypothetical protein
MSCLREAECLCGKVVGKAFMSALRQEIRLSQEARGTVPLIYCRLREAECLCVKVVEKAFMSAVRQEIRLSQYA